MVNLQPFLYGFEVIIATPGGFAPFEQAGHQFIFLYHQINQQVGSFISRNEKRFQRLGLSHCTWKTIEYYSVIFAGNIVDALGNYFNYHFVRNKLPLRDVRLGFFAYLGFVLNFFPQ